MTKPMSVQELNVVDKRMIELWNSGFTGQMLAEYFGKTRNAILGRLSRLRDAGHNVSVKGQLNPNKNKQEKPKLYNTSEERAITRRVKDAIKKLDSRKKKDLTHEDDLIRIDNFDRCKDTRVRIYDLKSHHCRYIIDNRNPDKSWYCGHPKEVNSYCGYHAKLCYLPPDRQRSKQSARKSSFAYGRTSR